MYAKRAKTNHPTSPFTILYSSLPTTTTYHGIILAIVRLLSAISRLILRRILHLVPPGSEDASLQHCTFNKVSRLVQAYLSALIPRCPEVISTNTAVYPSSRKHIVSLIMAIMDWAQELG